MIHQSVHNCVKLSRNVKITLSGLPTVFLGETVNIRRQVLDSKACRTLPAQSNRSTFLDLSAAVDGSDTDDDEEKETSEGAESGSSFIGNYRTGGVLQLKSWHKDR